MKVTSNKWKFKAKKEKHSSAHSHRRIYWNVELANGTNAFSTYYFMRRWNCHNSYAICKAQWFEHEKRSAWIFRILIWARTNQLKNCNNKKYEKKKSIQTHGAAQTNDCNSILVLVLFFSWCLCGVKIYSFIISANYGNSTDNFVHYILFLFHDCWVCMFFCCFLLSQHFACSTLRFKLHCNHLCFVHSAAIIRLFPFNVSNSHLCRNFWFLML